MEQEIAITTHENADIKRKDEGGDEFLQRDKDDKDKQAQTIPASNYKNLHNHLHRHQAGDTVPSEISLDETTPKRVQYKVRSEFFVVINSRHLYLLRNLAGGRTAGSDRGTFLA